LIKWIDATIIRRKSLSIREKAVNITAKILQRFFVRFEEGKAGLLRPFFIKPALIIW